MPGAGFDNAIGWAQFKLLGGWKNILATSAGYAAIGAALIFGVVRASREPASAVYGYFIPFFLSVQVLALLLYGTLRVGSAVRADVNSRLLESHRLMPTAPAAAVLGYLFGSTFQTLLLFVLNFLLGAVCVAGAGIRLQPWLFSNLVLLGFSVFVWTIVLFFSFRTGAAALGIVVAMVLMLFSRGAPLELLPGLHLLISPMIGETIFDMRVGRRFSELFLFAAAIQAFVAVFYIIAAARRYSRDDALGFDSALGLLLLLAWTVASVAAMRSGEIISWRLRGAFPTRGNEGPLVASASAVLLLAILPVSSAVRAALAERRADRGWQAPPVLTVIASIVIASGIVFAVRPFDRSPLPVLRTVLVVAAFLLGVRYVLGMAHRFKWGPRKIVFGWLMLTWGLPVIVEMIRSATAEDPENDHLSQISMISPPAEIYQVWSHDLLVHSDAYTGLAIQCLLAVVMALAYHAAQHRRR